MRSFALSCCAFLLAVTFGQPAFAVDWDAKRVEKVGADLKAGKAVAESGSVPKADSQIVTVAVSDTLSYIIDYRAKVCFAHTTGTAGATGTAGTAGTSGLAFVPCQILKRGYPSLAPLLGGDEGMQHQMPPSMMRRENAPGGAQHPQGPPPRPKK